MLQGVHPRTVMELLGHKDLNTSMKIYGHVVDAMKQDAVNRMDQLFGPVATSEAPVARVRDLPLEQRFSSLARMAPPWRWSSKDRSKLRTKF